MSKITLTSVGDLTQPTTAASTINANNAVIQTAFDNTLSRNGTSPNTMSANLDMNNNSILNLAAPTSNSSPARLSDIVAAGGTVNITNTGNLPAGGSSNQLLTKNSSTNYDASWTSSPSIASITNSGTITIPATTDQLIARATTDTLTNKTIAGADNTLTVRLANDVTGNLPVTNLNSGTSASGSSFWCGDNTWKIPPSSAQTLLETLSLSGSSPVVSTVTWTGYTSIEIVYYGLTGTGVTNNFPGLQLHSNSAYQATQYLVNNVSQQNSSVTFSAGTSPTTYYPITGNFNVGSFQSGGKLTISNIPGTTGYKLITGLASAVNTGLTQSWLIYHSGMWTGNTALDGCQFLIGGSGASYSTGTVKIYGIS